MDAAKLHGLARHLRGMALEISSNPDESRVSASELAIVEDVASHPKTSIGDIARRTGLAQSLVSRVVAAKQNEGVFSTETAPTDRRKSLVSIDSATYQHIFRARGARTITDKLRQALPSLTPDEFDRVLTQLEELATVFEAQRRKPA